MGRKLRIFVSSTMKDLRNERSAVVQRLSSFNFEPVNAEGWLPNGKKSWPRIQSEIESSDVFVLILGLRYGWIPDRGPKSELGLSVTHLELLEAQNLDLPVLAFLKRLEYDDDRASEDAKKRDQLRKEVRDWDDGFITAEFELAQDLADLAGLSVIEILKDEFQNARVQRRSEAATNTALALEREASVPKAPVAPPIPDDLIDAVRRGNAILFGGSGISLAAGLPSANAFAQNLIQLVRETDPAYSVNPTGAAFAGIATDLEASRGRKYLTEAIRDLIHPPQGVEPTDAHKWAVTLFNHIITTNYDDLFESAAAHQGLEVPVISEEFPDSLPTKVIIKLHGTASNPESLLLTERDVFMFDRSRPKLWSALQSELRTKLLVVVGTSLRDPSIVRFLSEVGPDLRGYFVVPYFWESTPARLLPWNLQCIQSDADTFLSHLAKEVNATRDGEDRG